MNDVNLLEVNYAYKNHTVHDITQAGNQFVAEIGYRKGGYM